MSLYCLAFITDDIQSDRSLQFSFGFNFDQTYMINNVIVLPSFRPKPYLIKSVTTTQFHFQLRLHLYNQLSNCFVWLSSQTAPNQIGLNSSVSIFGHRPDLYDRSRHCPIMFLSYIELDSTGHGSSVSFSTWTASKRFVM